MNLSYRWLQSLLPSLTAAPESLVERFAQLGVPVDEIVDIGAPLKDVVLARVLEAGRHPNADRLSLCRVDAGTGEPLSVVCGAPNVTAGKLYPFAPVGAQLPGGVQIRKAKIRGETSEGMLCSPREIGLGKDHDGIMELGEVGKPGDSFVAALGLDDVRFAIDVTPNRPDMLSHFGVARELGENGEASIELKPFADVRVTYAAGSPEARTDAVSVQLDDLEGCPRYLGLVIRGVRVAESPEWLKSRLRAVGLRPVNNVVDATNYVLHELGQPLHAFDLAKVGNRIVVRRARAGEQIVTLDGATRKLTDEMLVIADAERPVALAGVMGGQDTEVTNDTTDLLLECALFDPRRTRRTRQGAGLSTDASQRFERGVDPTGMRRAAERAAALIVAIAGGRVDDVAADAGAAPAEPAPIRLPAKRIPQVLGVPVTLEEARALLEPLGFVCNAEDSALSVRVPGHRRYDVFRADDLIEEIARRRGYDSFPQELRAFRPSAVPDDVLSILERRLRERLVAEGFHETRSVPFAAENEGDVPLQLPLSSAESRLRRTITAGLLHRLELNFSRGLGDVRLFEVGTVFAPGEAGELPEERTHLALVFTGARAPRHWSAPPAAFDVWDLKGMAERLAGSLGLRVEPGDGELRGLQNMLRSGTVLRLVASDGELRGLAGGIRSSAVDAPAWAEAVWVIEVELRADMASARPFVYVPLPEYPAIERDLAFVAPDRIAAGDLERALRGSAGPLLETVEVFDLYRGKPIAEGARSLAFRLRFRAPDRTLTDEEIDRVIQRVVRRLEEEHGVRQRA